MSNNIDIKDALQQNVTMATTDNGGVHTPVHQVGDGTTKAIVDPNTNGLKTHGVSNNYQKETLSTTADVVLGTTGAIGDQLVSLYFPTAPGEDIIIQDDTTEVLTLPSALITAGFKIDLDILSVSGAWSIKQTTTATDDIVAIGRFT